MCVVLDKTTTNVLWPLSGGKYRWSFQLSQPGEFGDRTKDRIPFEIEEAPGEHDSKHVLQQLIGERAPWFREKINAVTWTAEVQFERRLAKRFGHGRCWLAGDAVHQTAPIGMQSMNVGVTEAEELACKFAGILRDNAPLDSLQAYGTNSHLAWQRLLGLKEGMTSGTQASPWVQERAARIVSCIPASGAELAQLASQIGLQF
jgi:2-polyprenyl-6-methoxyphenol hydroxylase-like FAD-dependent oxidoreductase